MSQAELEFWSSQVWVDIWAGVPLLIPPRESAAGLVRAALLPGTNVNFPQITEICERVADKPPEAADAISMLAATLSDVHAPIRKKLKALTIANEMMYDESARLTFRCVDGLHEGLVVLRGIRGTDLGSAMDENIRMLATEVDRAVFEGHVPQQGRLRGLGSALLGNFRQQQRPSHSPVPAQQMPKTTQPAVAPRQASKEKPPQDAPAVPAPPLAPARADVSSATSPPLPVQVGAGAPTVFTPNSTVPAAVSEAFSLKPPTLGTELVPPSMMQAPPVEAPSLPQTPAMAPPSMIEATSVSPPSMLQAPPGAPPSMMQAPPVAPPSLAQASPATSPSMTQASPVMPPSMTQAPPVAPPFMVQAQAVPPPSTMQVPPEVSPPTTAAIPPAVSTTVEAAFGPPPFPPTTAATSPPGTLGPFGQTSVVSGWSAPVSTQVMADESTTLAATSPLDGAQAFNPPPSVAEAFGIAPGVAESFGLSQGGGFETAGVGLGVSAAAPSQAASGGISGGDLQSLFA
eukprot:TRINITY_DN9423_c1_g1_i2.p1 TRINITY_DN9423_c1_g1~~TRINITY_DN9423_c1_g1_i2.p1  ORF type:complete len:540 (-),score=136.34 TRINITY_DN9423_c1_g1_i2:134-1678(-)